MHILLLALLLGTALDDEPRVTKAVREAVADYLVAPPGNEKAAFRSALKKLDGDLALATAALRAATPLTKAKPGTEHGLKFESGGNTFEFSIHLPKDYDGRQRFPVLVLPDHGAVDAESGIGFWRDKNHAEHYILFRPVIHRHRQDARRFKDQSFFGLDQSLAEVMRDGLRHLRLHYAVDPDRLVMTGLSQAGYSTWYFAVTMPDEFAAIAPESAGGTGVVAAILPLAANARELAVRILHHEADAITPYEHAQQMNAAIEEAGGDPELVTYTDADYLGEPFPNRHPGPHHLRLSHVLPWGHLQRREPPDSFTRVLRYRHQGREGRFVLEPPKSPSRPQPVQFSSEDGRLSSDAKGVRYHVSPEDLLSGRDFSVRGKRMSPKADLELLLADFKRHGDLGRLAAAEIRVTR